MDVPRAPRDSWPDFFRDLGVQCSLARQVKGWRGVSAKCFLSILAQSGWHTDKDTHTVQGSYESCGAMLDRSCQASQK